MNARLEVVAFIARCAAKATYESPKRKRGRNLNLARASGSHCPRRIGRAAGNSPMSQGFLLRKCVAQRCQRGAILNPFAPQALRHYSDWHAQNALRIGCQHGATHLQPCSDAWTTQRVWSNAEPH